MLKKIGRLFLKAEPSANNIAELKYAEQPADHPAELQPNAEELKKNRKSAF